MQRVRSNPTHCWCQRTVYSTTSTTRATVGHLDVGMRQLLLRARNEACSCVPSRCCYLVASPSSVASSSFVVRNISRVSSKFSSQTDSCAGIPSSVLINDRTLIPKFFEFYWNFLIINMVEPLFGRFSRRSECFNITNLISRQQIKGRNFLTSEVRN